MTIEKLPGVEDDGYANGMRRLRKRPAYLVGIFGHGLLALFFACRAFLVEWPGWSGAAPAIFLFLVILVVYLCLRFSKTAYSYHANWLIVAGFVLPAIVFVNSGSRAAGLRDVNWDYLVYAILVMVGFLCMQSTLLANVAKQVSDEKQDCQEPQKSNVQSGLCANEVRRLFNRPTYLSGAFVYLLLAFIFGCRTILVRSAGWSEILPSIIFFLVTMMVHLWLTLRKTRCSYYKGGLIWFAYMIPFTLLSQSGARVEPMWDVNWDYFAYAMLVVAGLSCME